MKNRYNQKNEPQLDPQIASQMLSNIFISCEYEPNTIPLEVLSSYSNYRKERHLLQKGILIAVMLLFFALPVLFIAPDYTIIEKEGTTPGNPIAEITINNHILVDKVTASIGGAQKVVYKISDNTYQVHPETNGTLEVTVHLRNTQYTTKIITIADADTEEPKLLNSEYYNNSLIIYFSDNSGTLDFEHIYASSVDGSNVKPIAYDEQHMSVTFEYPSNNLNLFIPDKSGNTLQIIVSLK